MNIFSIKQIGKEKWWNLGLIDFVNLIKLTGELLTNPTGVKLYEILHHHTIKFVHSKSTLD